MTRAAPMFLYVFICRYYWNPRGTYFWELELNCESHRGHITKHWKSIMKLINSESLFSGTWASNLSFKFLVITEFWLHSVVQICPSSIKKWHHLRTFPSFMKPCPHTHKLAKISAGRMCFMLSNQITECIPLSAGSVIDMVLLWRPPIQSMDRQIMRTWQTARRRLPTFKNLWSMTSMGRFHKWFLLYKLNSYTYTTTF